MATMQTDVDMETKFKELCEPFKSSDIEWRIGRSGVKGDNPWATCLAYVTNRAIMNRLDKVIGPDRWKNEYTKGPEGGILCGLSLKIGEEWVTKWDGAENTQFEGVKGGLSGAMKRSAVMWGVGRYLYKLDEGFADINPQGQNYQSFSKGKNGKPDVPAFKWNPPALPDWALPKDEKPAPKMPDKKDFPPEATEFFTSQGFSLKQVKEFCEPHGWDWDLIKKAISALDNSEGSQTNE